MRRSCQAIVVGALISCASSLHAQEFGVSLADRRWAGDYIPQGEQCERLGGHGSTPALMVSGIPRGATALIIEYGNANERNMKRGHGRIGYRLREDVSHVYLVPMRGHSFDLPSERYFVVEPHRGDERDKAGIYLPPCSQGDLYTVTVSAVKEEGGEVLVLAEQQLALGWY